MQIKKVVLSISLFLLAFVVLVPQVMALEIEVRSNGDILFYEDGVLGESTSSLDNTATQPVKKVPVKAHKKLQVNTKDRGVKIKLQDRDSGPALYKRAVNNDRRSFTKGEEIETGRLQMHFPAGQTDAQSARAAKRHEAKERAQGARSKVREHRQGTKEDYKAYRDKLKDQRQERREEMVELRNQIKTGGGQALELKSRNVRARLRGAQFELDPETNDVILTTPSGQEHVLQHLPDQALARMKDAGVLDQFAQVDDVELETTADGEVLYKARVKKARKLFGLFNRQVDTEVIVDDQTGEVAEQEVEAKSAFARFLNRFSY